MSAASPFQKDAMEVPDEEANESRLVEAAMAGDHDAFARLFHQYHAMIHALAYRFCLETADAQDIAQETFIKAAKSLGNYRGESSFKNWLCRVAVNTSRDWWRKKARERQAHDTFEADRTARAGGRPGDFDEVREALKALPGDLRMAVVLVYYEGFSHAEAARALDCAEATVSWRIFTAKRKLKGLLGKEGTRR